MMADIRAFVAIDLPPVFQSNLESVIRQLRDQLPSVAIRWVPVKNIHLTLKFLGDTPQQKISLLEKNLKEEAARHHPFDLALGQAGAFPSVNKPRVIWVGLSAAEDLKLLAHGIERQAGLLGWTPEERPFSPHLTLGRVGRDLPAAQLRRIGEALQSIRVEPSSAYRVTDFHLYRSDLQPAGAVYTRLFSVSLG